MSSPPEDFDAEPNQEANEPSRLERLFPELLKRVIETGTRNLSPEAVRQVLGDLKLPREALHYTFSQLDETKNGVYRIVAKELHDLFERTNIAEEVAKALSLLSLEVKMEVRFKPTSVAMQTKVSQSSPPSAQAEASREPEPQAPGKEDSKESEDE